MKNNTIVFKGDLSWSDFEKVSEILDRKENVTIYLFSNGGPVNVGMSLLDLINRPNNRDHVTIAGGSLNSVCFDLFFKAKCNRYILAFADGMYHQTKVDIAINEDGRPTYHSGVHTLSWIKSMHPETLRVATTLKFSDIEMRKLKRGDDLFFLHDRLVEFLKLSNNL